MKNKLSNNNKEFYYNNKYLDKIFIFLNEFLSKKVSEIIIFDYTNKISLYSKNKEKKHIILGKIFCFNIKEEKLYIYNKKTYKPYYNENDLNFVYNFKDIGFDKLINILIIKYLFFCGKCQKKSEGVNNFPLFVILSFAKDKQIIDLLKIDNRKYSKDKYNDIVNKYKLLLIDFFNQLKLDDENYKKLYNDINN